MVIDKNLGGTLPLEVIIRFPNNKNDQNASDTLDSFESEFENLATQETYWFDSKNTHCKKFMNF